MKTLHSIDPIATLLGVSTLLAVAIAPASVPGPVQGAPPCCAITAVDAARQAVTARHAKGNLTFEITLADAAQARGLRAGEQVSFSTNPMVLAVAGRGAAPVLLAATSIRAVTPTPQSSSGAVASAASAPGTFRRDAPRGGKCVLIKETSTQQCVLTHDRTAEGKGCEYFCVPINER